MSTAVDDEIVDLLGAGRTVAAVAVAEQELGRRGGTTTDPQLLDAWAKASLAAGRHCVDVRDAVGGAYYDHAALGDDEGAGVAATVRGRLELAAGRAASATRWTARAIRALGGRGGRALRTAHAVRTQAEALLGHDVGAALEGVGGAEGTPAVRPDERTDLLLATAWGVAARGEPVRGSEILLGAVRDCGDRISDEAEVLHAALRLGAPPARIAGRLAELASAVDGPVVPLYAHRAAALVDDDGLALDLTASGFEALGLDLLAAETWGEATAAYRRQGGRTSSVALTLSSARMALARCEGASSPSLAATLHDRPWPTAGRAVMVAGRSTRPLCGAR